MEPKIKIDIVSDVVCPWCIVGYKRLEKAIVEMGIQDRVEIEWQPFELNPQMPPEGENVNEHISRKYGTTQEDNRRSKEQLSKLGAEVDFKFDYFEDMKMPNTLDAHILIDYARENGKQTELNVRLVEAYFSERKDISKREILLQELNSIGLDKQEALKRLDDADARLKLKEKEAYWKNKGIRSVPTMLFNGANVITGAHPLHVYKQVLTGLLK
ncbi:MAG: DsbA family oxidoreductase [Paludibacter sp.]|jgi:predicted DsbA family dithiol-disulfide isomerase|nr:DsbA family oxidoreductase [Paludibacter sp.]